MSLVAIGIDAETILESISDVGISHVVIVPDTHQQTVLDRLDNEALPLIRCSTEDDVLGVCAGLWMTGARPLALIQQLGIFASVNALRAFSNDQHVPICILAGMYGRNVELPVEVNSASSVRLCTPILDALGVRWRLIETPDQKSEIAPGLAAAFDEGIASAVLLGAPTC